MTFALLARTPLVYYLLVQKHEIASWCMFSRSPSKAIIDRRKQMARVADFRMYVWCCLLVTVLGVQMVTNAVPRIFHTHPQEVNCKVVMARKFAPHRI